MKTRRICSLQAAAFRDRPRAEARTLASGSGARPLRPAAGSRPSSFYPCTGPLRPSSLRLLAVCRPLAPPPSAVGGPRPGEAGRAPRARALRRRRAALEGAARAAAPAPRPRPPSAASAARAAAMAEDSESAASQQSLELDDQDTCGIDGDNEEETEHAKG